MARPSARDDSAISVTLTKALMNALMAAEVIWSEEDWKLSRKKGVVHAKSAIPHTQKENMLCPSPD